MCIDIDRGEIEAYYKEEREGLIKEVERMEVFHVAKMPIYTLVR